MEPTVNIKKRTESLTSAVFGVLDASGPVISEIAKSVARYHTAVLACSTACQAFSQAVLKLHPLCAGTTAAAVKDMSDLIARQGELFVYASKALENSAESLRLRSESDKQALAALDKLSRRERERQAEAIAAAEKAATRTPSAETRSALIAAQRESDELRCAQLRNTVMEWKGRIMAVSSNVLDTLVVLSEGGSILTETRKGVGALGKALRSSVEQLPDDELALDHAIEAETPGFEAVRSPPLSQTSSGPVSTSVPVSTSSPSVTGATAEQMAQWQQQFLQHALMQQQYAFQQQQQWQLMHHSPEAVNAFQQQQQAMLQQALRQAGSRISPPGVLRQPPSPLTIPPHRTSSMAPVFIEDSSSPVPLDTRKSNSGTFSPKRTLDSPTSSPPRSPSSSHLSTSPTARSLLSGRWVVKMKRSESMPMEPNEVIRQPVSPTSTVSPSQRSSIQLGRARSFRGLDEAEKPLDQPTDGYGDGDGGDGDVAVVAASPAAKATAAVAAAPPVSTEKQVPEHNTSSSARDFGLPPSKPLPIPSVYNTLRSTSYTQKANLN